MQPCALLRSSPHQVPPPCGQAFTSPGSCSTQHNSYAFSLCIHSLLPPPPLHLSPHSFLLPPLISTLKIVSFEIKADLKHKTKQSRKRFSGCNTEFPLSANPFTLQCLQRVSWGYLPSSTHSRTSEHPSLALVTSELSWCLVSIPSLHSSALGLFISLFKWVHLCPEL